MIQTSQITASNALALDVGDKRIGLARVNFEARIPEPLPPIDNSKEAATQIKSLADEYDADLLVVGLPRNMSGQETAQSALVRQFVDEALKPVFTGQIIFQDETLTTHAAKQYPSDMLEKYGYDSLAATEILSDFLSSLENADV